jgi:hypothetical protein
MVIAAPTRWDLTRETQGYHEDNAADFQTMVFARSLQTCFTTISFFIKPFPNFCLQRILGAFGSDDVPTGQAGETSKFTAGIL